jgi:hypothetical protein
VVTTLKNFVSGADMSGIQLSQSRTAAAPTVATTNSSSIAPAVGTDAYKLFNGKIVVGQKIYQIAGGSTYTFTFNGLNSAKRYSAAFFATRDDSRYTVKSKLTLLGASGWTNASSAGSTAIAGTNDATVEVDVCQNSAANGRLVRWNDISISGTSFSVKIELGSAGTSFVVPQCVALIEYDVPTEIAAPEITTQPLGANITSGNTHTLTVAASGSDLTYQWYEGTTGDTTQPVSGATAATFTTPALTETKSYWVKISNPAGVQLSQTASVVIEAAPPVLTPFQTWAQTHALNGAYAASTADPDGDGIVNLLEFALGGNPNAASASLMPTASIPEPDILGLTFHRATGALKYVVESSATLAAGSWIPEYTLEKNAEPETVGQDITVEVPIDGAARKFLRLQISE